MIYEASVSVSSVIPDEQMVHGQVSYGQLFDATLPDGKSPYGERSDGHCSDCCCAYGKANQGEPLAR